MSASLFTEKEIRNFSFTRGFNAILESQKGQPPGCAGKMSGLELEISDALAAHFRPAPNSPPPTGSFVPLAAFKGLSATQFQYGGALVNSEFAPASIVPALRATTTVVEMGATVFDSLVGDCVLPYANGTSTAQWLADLQTAADGSEPSFARSTLSPRRVVALTRVSRQLLKQNSLGAELFLRRELLKTVSTALDKGCLTGAGGVEPLGILNRVDSSLNSITFSGSPTFAKLVDMQTQVALDAGYNDSVGYVTSPGAASKMLQTKADSTGIQMLWQGSVNSGQSQENAREAHRK